ncbi:UNVERIFIED_CONTAM: hypothetical protein Scaly_0208500 [Sesamum calycinum]|uniref:Uncharacterized protein n=1 Tax=Sesamum calycinum TaxID=2727403 RepID=A0AAW2T1B6_9LAMI
MSLVDYAASSDEDEPQSLLANKRMSRNSSNLQPTSSKQTDIVSNQSSELKLPDASFLLNSPVVSSNLLNASDHSSRVAAAMAESAARKRDLNGSSGTYPRSKVPKGTLPHSKSVPDTGDGRLLPSASWKNALNVHKRCTFCFLC